MQILLQHLAQRWLMAGELSPIQRREIFEYVSKLLELLPAMALSSWSFILAGMSTTYLTTCQFLDKSEGAIAFFAVVLIMLGIGLNVLENRSVGLSAASVRFFKIDLRMQGLSSGCLIVGLLLLLLLFSRFVWVNALGHQGF
jgi:hypothetical protein